MERDEARDRYLVAENQRIHDRIAADYDRNHPEITNPTEQARLARALRTAATLVRCREQRALDFGAGTGNVTGKLLALDPPFHVTAVDVSPGILGQLTRKHADAIASGRLETRALDGDAALPFPDEHFALVTCYSVLHHVPDYFRAVREMARVVSPGGVLFIDHEWGVDHWRSPPAVRAHRALTMPRYAIGRVAARLRALMGRPERRIGPVESREPLEEGDIHVYQDDHIEWGRVRELAVAAGLTEIATGDYLLCREDRLPIRHWLFRRFAADMGIYVGRKEGAVSPSPTA